MGHLASVEQLNRRGRFSEALQVLERSPIPTHERLAADTVRVELLERTGRYSASKTLAELVLRNPDAYRINAVAASWLWHIALSSMVSSTRR
jgi:hypothetical protein